MPAPHEVQRPPARLPSTRQLREGVVARRHRRRGTARPVEVGIVSSHRCVTAPPFLPSCWPNYNFTQPARYPSYRYHTCGRVLHGLAIPGARDWSGSAFFFYSATQRDLILTGFKRRQRKLHGLSRERDAVLRRGGGLCWTRSLQGERSYISMGHHVQWYQLVVPRYPYGILVVVAYSGFARGP